MPANAPHDLLTTRSLYVMFLKAKEADVDMSMLNSEQLTALRLAEDLNSFFLTGDPGTGKTFTLLKIIEVLSTLLKPSQLGITASTGAATNRLQDFITQNLCKTELPFGGICIITSGDFLQLPPVPLGGKSVQFAFQSPAWDAAFKENHIRLTTVYRQNEEGLLDLLKEIRMNNIMPWSQALLAKQQKPIPASYLPHLETVCLYLPVGSVVQLKVGACIILRKNIGKGLFNGSMGIVLGFYSSHHILPPDKRAEKPQTLRSIHNIKVDDNGIPIHAPPGPVCTLGGHKQMLFPLVKFEIGSTCKHVLVLDKEFVFQSVKGNKEYMATRFQV
ncbi:hypothetical protein BDR04DRAFT_1163527 [Suillus decipiens]|nr:hypothetical protein BDR04DRAFT_1163527 [Suillus decipiens]